MLVNHSRQRYPQRRKYVSTPNSARPPRATAMNVATRMGSCRGRASRVSRPRRGVVILVLVLVRHHVIHAHRAWLDAAVQDVVIKLVVHAREAAGTFVLAGLRELQIVFAREAALAGAGFLHPLIEVRVADAVNH